MRNRKVSGGVSLFLLMVGVGLPQQKATPAQAALRDQIVAKEREELDCLKNGNSATFANLLADEAVFVDAHGASGKAEVVQHIAEFRLHEYSMADVRFVPLSPESGLIVYKLNQSGISHGKEFKAQVHVSAVWIKRDGRWICLFSQETAAK